MKDLVHATCGQRKENRTQHCPNSEATGQNSQNEFLDLKSRSISKTKISYISLHVTPSEMYSKLGTIFP